MKQKILYFVFILSIIISSSSCSTYKNVPYFQDLDHSKITENQVENYSPLIIKPADILGINVNSRNPESSAVFNYNLNRVNGGSMDSSPENPITGYMVDDKGDIHLPLIGNLKVAGLTTSQLSVKLDQMLLTYYKDPVVNIRLINFKVSVFGDVLRPNVYTLQSERTTITEALTLAGDLNITAKRTNIILIREQDGKRMFIPIDLTSKTIFDSPYYYLRNNDEIYVQADRVKYSQVDSRFQVASLIVAALSVLAIVFTAVHNHN
ncbi:polysaccharide biosynthesis/export family protein [Mucilaginibacter sp.]